MLLAAVLLTLLPREPSEAHQGERLYVIPEITDEMLSDLDLHDGSIHDWEDLIEEPALTLIDFVIVPNPPSFEARQLDPSDLDFRIWLGWNAAADRIYVAAILSDDVYVNEYDRHGRWIFMTEHDMIAIMLDGDHSGGRWAPEGTRVDPQEERLFFNQQAQVYTAISYVTEGSTVGLHPTSQVWWGDNWMVTPPYAEGGGSVYGEKPLFWVVEFAVTPFDRLLWNDPGESRVSELEAGKIIGFNMWVSDRDRGPETNFEDFYELALTSEPTADLFVDGLLLGAASAPGEEGSVVQDVSWGRIKASLDFE